MENNMDLAAMSARLTVLEDERSILQILYRYGHSIDYGLEKDWIDCFTDDGTFDIRYATGRNCTRHEDSEALAIFISRHTQAPAKYHKHFMVEPRITINGNGATVESYFARLDNLDGEPYILAFGRYRDRMCKCADGTWRFKERIAEIEAQPKN